MEGDKGLKRLKVLLMIKVLFMTLLYAPLSYADDAQVLPEGRFRLRIRGLYTNYDERFNPQKNREPIGVDFDKVNVNNSVFPALPPGPLTLGITSFNSKVEEFAYPIYLAYGFTERVSLGIVIPVLNIKRKVNFSISGGNVGFLPGTTILLPTCDIQPAPCAPAPVDTEDAQTILESPAFGLELKRLKGFNRTGIGDIRFGFKHLYFKTEHLRLAYSLSLRLPTGEPNDPDDLLDIPFGDGQSDIVLELHNDLLPSEKTILNLYIRYTLQLPDHEDMRIQKSANEPIVPKANKENMRRNLGDYFESEVMFGYRITESVNLGLSYYFLYKGRDGIESPTNSDTESLENETDKRGHTVRMSLGYSTFPAFLQKRFPFPMEFIVEGSKVLKGRNIPVSTTIGIDLRFFF
jgi:hypothetical protein